MPDHVMRTFLNDFRAVGPGVHNRVTAARAGVSVAVPLLTLVTIDRLEWAPFCAFGALVVIYARATERRHGNIQLLQAGLALVLAVTLGTAAALTAHPTLWLVVGGSLVAAATAFASDLLEWKPPGGVFTLFAFSVCTLTQDATWRTVALAAALSITSASFSILVCNIGPRGSGTRTRHRTVRQHLAEPSTRRHTARHFLAPLLTGAAAVSLNIGHPYWGMVASIVPLTAPNLLAMAHRGMHRIVGTLTGVAMAGVYLLLDPSPAMLVIGIIACQIATELLVMRHYALALTFITPLALLMGQLAHPMPTGDVVIQRTVETVLGVVIGLAVAGLIRRPPIYSNSD